MGRPREFDPETVLDKAMNVFWAKGYEATSLDDLCEATGLGRSSLYAAFGDKRTLYLEALGHYESAACERISAALGCAESPLAGVAEFVDRVISDIVSGPGRRGCFIGNCAAELARQDESAATRVRQSLERVQSTFRAALESAQRRGEIAKGADVDALAQFLTAGIQGLRLVGKANPDRATLEAIARIMLNALGGRGIRRRRQRRPPP